MTTTHACSLSRRDFLARSGLGFGALALGGLLRDAGLVSAAPVIDPVHPLAPRPPHFAPKAKQVIHIFANGGPSHVDTFDPKPMLQKFAGKMLPRPNLGTERKTGAAYPSPFRPSAEAGTKAGAATAAPRAVAVWRKKRRRVTLADLLII